MKNDCWSNHALLHVPTYSVPCSSVGDSAKNAFHSNPQNTVFDAKRLIGRKFDDPELLKDMKHWSVLPTPYEH